MPEAPPEVRDEPDGDTPDGLDVDAPDAPVALDSAPAASDTAPVVSDTPPVTVPVLPADPDRPRGAGARDAAVRIIGRGAGGLNRLIRKRRPDGGGDAGPYRLVVDGQPPATPPKGPPLHWYEVLLPVSHRVPVLTTFLTSLLICVGFLTLPLSGTDLSAQVARGHFFREHGFVPIDFRWYGGVYPFGYSALTGPLNSLLGSRGVGVVACVISAVALSWLLARVGARHPTAGGVLGALVGVFNLFSGRTTFALGLAFGMLALCALVLPRVPLTWRLVIAAVLAALSSAGSPVSGVFTGMAGVSLILVGRYREGLALGIGAGVALLPPALLFRDGGMQPFTEEAMKVSVAISVAVFFLVPKKYKAVRAGAVLAALSAAACFYLPNPLGSNVARLPTLYAAPIVVAVATLDRRVLAGVVALMCWWQPPLVAGDLSNAGTREASRAFYEPLTDELVRRGPVGRIEVVPMRDHWEATYVADVVPIARGWERQVDVERNRLFYNGTLTPATYLNWLYGNAIEYVAVPRDTRLDFGGREEAALIEADLPYLKKVWETGDWQLYQVVGGQTLVQYPGQLVESGPTGVRFDVPVATDLTVRVRWSRWLTLKGPDGCIEPDGEWVKVKLARSGSYELTAAMWLPGRTHC